ncbi:hypothetical protein G6F62_007918 [Rhizopus arrhizus]|nr:hypothetical protein G6F62_007918 [Rhizopus arrhizus]
MQQHRNSHQGEREFRGREMNVALELYNAFTWVPSVPKLVTMVFARIEEAWYVGLSSYENHIVSIEEAVQPKDKFEYKNGERIVPCRTPVTGEKRVDVALLSSTSIWTSSNKFRSRLMSAAGAGFSSVCHIWRRSTVTYADLMSKNASTGVVR